MPTFEPKQETTRRDFVKLGGAALAVAATSSARSASAASYAKIPGANDRVRTGIIGCGDRMLRRRRARLRYQPEGYELRVGRGLRHLEARPRAGADFVEKAERKQRSTWCATPTSFMRARTLTRCLIATADFQHARHGIEAVKAGRDAYVEKPTAHRMDDARTFLKAVEGSNQVIAVGTQRRSTPAYMKAAEYIQSGKFGDIVMVEMSWNVNQPGRWRRPDVVPTAERGGYRLEPLLHGRDHGQVRRAQVPRVPAVLAVFIGHSRPMAGPPDRYRALVHRVAASAFGGRQWRHLPMEGWPDQLGHDDRGLRLRPAGRPRPKVSRCSTLRGSPTRRAA